MPVGSPNTQTRATKKYQDKVGYIAKSYKIKKELADEFARCCEQEGVSQAAKISDLMREFINQVREK